jgi:hypothetical protein
MAFSMFQACVPVITQMLNGMASVVDKATAHVAEKELDQSAPLQARLFPDMFTLGRQIRQATDFGPRATRLAGVELPAFPETDASFAEAKARIAKLLDFIKGFGPAQIDGTGEKDISWKAGERQMSFKGQAYLLHFCLPHFFFHCTTAYNILRLNGVELGTRDYRGSLQRNRRRGPAPPACDVKNRFFGRGRPRFSIASCPRTHSGTTRGAAVPTPRDRRNRRCQAICAAQPFDVCSTLAEAGPDAINDRHIRVVPTCFENGGAGQAKGASPIS